MPFDRTFIFHFFLLLTVVCVNARSHMCICVCVRILDAEICTPCRYLHLHMMCVRSRLESRELQITNKNACTHSCMCAPAQINQISREFLWHISRTLTHTHAHNYNNIKIKRYSSEKTAPGKNFLFDRTKNDKRKWEWDTCNKYRMKESERESVNSRTMIVVVRYGIVYWKLASSKLCKRGRKCEREKI